jgi:hypothetical protein
LVLAHSELVESSAVECLDHFVVHGIDGHSVELFLLGVVILVVLGFPGLEFIGNFNGDVAGELFGLIVE